MMLEESKMKRINALAAKKKQEGLTEAEKKEQSDLREEYLAVFRKGMRKHIEGLKVVDPVGNDVTPDKLKTIQKSKKLLKRHLEE